jgi:hypothetical protein
MLRCPNTGGEIGYVTPPSSSVVAWCWKKQAGSFDVVTYSGTSSAQSIAHSLGVAPKFMIVKCRNATSSWQVYHHYLGNQAAMFLDQTSTGVRNDNTRWNSTSPTSTHFTVGTDGGMNGSGRTFVAYLWAEVPGFSSFGAYRGNSNTTGGPFIYTGLRPAFIMAVPITYGDNWVMVDSARDTYNNNANKYLLASSTNAEATSSSVVFDMLANGFKIRNTGWNSNHTYIYMAFAEHPLGGANVSPGPAR